MAKRYDYIIAGAGAAGLSLAYAIAESQLSKATILILDRDAKNSNDRTWCFWANGSTPFDDIVLKDWQQLQFADDQGFCSGNLSPLKYKMIRGLDFYQKVKQRLAALPNIEFRQEAVLGYTELADGASVQTTKATYRADYVFNSCLMPKPEQREGTHFLLQHFAGWWVRLEDGAFNPNEGRLMDFRTPQHGSTRFFYLLPIDEKRALIEYTVFSAERLPAADYQAALKDYLEQTLGLSHYEIEEHELGAIPMTDQRMPARMSAHVINIGTAAGAVKPTTGYAFANIQRQVQQLVKQLSSGQAPDAQLRSPSRFGFYDSLLLNILQHHGELGKGIFSRLFRYNRMKTILCFLSEQSKLHQEAGIFSTLPIGTFLRALGRVLWLRSGLASVFKSRASAVRAFPIPEKAQLP